MYSFILLPETCRLVHFQQKECLVSFISTMIVEIPVLNANSVDPDQTPHFAASDLGLHCLSMSFYDTPGINGLKRYRSFPGVGLPILCKRRRIKRSKFLARNTSVHQQTH